MMTPSPEEGLWQSYLDRATIDRHAARTALVVTIECDGCGRDGGLGRGTAISGGRW